LGGAEFAVIALGLHKPPHTSVVMELDINLWM
jgi:hypothetical protein